MGLYCGIDWASDHHDVAVIDDDGGVVARGRVGNDAAGFTRLLTLLAEAGDSPEHPIPVGIETDRGLWVATLRETGRVIYPINPLAASRYRPRYAVSGAKSDLLTELPQGFRGGCVPGGVGLARFAARDRRWRTAAGFGGAGGAGAGCFGGHRRSISAVSAG